MYKKDYVYGCAAEVKREEEVRAYFSLYYTFQTHQLDPTFLYITLLKLTLMFYKNKIEPKEKKN